ncbi:hypothetical protein BB560_007027 [Smittium megazygosporum]|uniref:Amine oxidase n=1 Tax=Smittium megazygosporum TaxID=133381 RepID=A0A2T9XZD5_9FUNG|nr:hypothetical protein BB560_007027 [Smittium megazygosporum]
MASEKVYDCIIIGAGLSGLVAARNLYRNGSDILVLEAQDRIGGRMVGKSLPSGQWIDQGGQWVGPTQDRFLNLLNEYKVKRFPTPSTGLKVLVFDGKRFEFDGFFQGHYEGEVPGVSKEEWLDATEAWTKFKKLSDELPEGHPFSGDKIEDLDSDTLERWIKDNTKTKFGHWYFSYMCRAVGFSGPSEPKEVSLLHALWGEKIASQSENPEAELLHGGAGQLPEKIASEFSSKIKINEPVHTISYGNGKVEVISQVSSYKTKYVIIAMPPHLAGHILYQPSLPALREQLTQRIPMGTCAKVLVSYKSPFWRKKGLAGIAIGNNKWVELCADSSDPETGVGVIAAFVAGDRYRKWQTLSESQRRDAVISDLKIYFGDEAGSYETFDEVNWPTNPWTGGGYTCFMPPGVWSSMGQALSSSIGPIYWAGTEMSDRWPGFFEGAIRTGEAAASDVMKLLE